MVLHVALVFQVGQASLPAPLAGCRLPWFSANSFLSLLLHGFGAPAFARNAYGLARLIG